LSGELTKVEFDEHPVFGLQVPTACTGVPSQLLYPRDTWRDKDQYDRAAIELAKKFISNFEKYSKSVGEEVQLAGPAVG
jgi:phosphoenolpyruvate carboxykinase (ATP)